MKKIKEKINFNYLKNNILFLLSGFGFYLITMQNNKYSLLFSLLLILIIFFTSICIRDVSLKYKLSSSIIKVLSIISASLLIYTFMTIFYNTFLLYIYEMFNYEINLRIFLISAIILAFVSLYFAIIFCNFIILEIINTLNGLIIYKSLKSILNNIYNNLFLIISSFTFLGYLNFNLSQNWIISLFISFFTILFVFSQVQNIFDRIKYISIKVKIYSFFSTLGICYFCYQKSNWGCIINNEFLSQILLIIATLLSSIIIFILVSLLLNIVYESMTNLIKSLFKKEKIIYLSLIILLFSFCTFAYLKSNAFYLNKDYIDYDIIYTSDSPYLIKENVYLNIFNDENDIRQPLFAIFSAPFIGFGYILSIPFSNLSEAVTPMFINFIQIPLLIGIFIMLGKMLNLSETERICFVLILTFSYTSLLFSIMIEQYIISCFWLILALYVYYDIKQSQTITFCAFTGTLITSGVLLPFICKINNNLVKYINEVKKKIICFIILLLSFCRFDIFLNLINRTKILSQFLGGRSFIEKFYQYSSFIATLFIAPETTIVNKYFYYSLQLSNNSAIRINIFGIVILVLCLVSFILNHKKHLVKICGFWIFYSFIVLCLLGWGSSENGMILYSLYFGWPYFVLLFELLKLISIKIKFRMFIPSVSMIFIIILFIYNYQGISELLRFAFTYYPS